jgi:transposase-like protein
LTTKAGDLELAIPKLRKGSFFPSILEPRRRIDQALYAVVMEAYVSGVSTRSVDALVESMGAASGISKSEVSRICAGLDERVAAFRNRTLGHTEFPYVYFDAIYVHVRDDALGQVVSRAIVVATGVTAQGGREVLGDTASARLASSDLVHGTAPRSGAPRWSAVPRSAGRRRGIAGRLRQGAASRDVRCRRTCPEALPAAHRHR